MDADTRQELEKIAKRVPRYLFRVSHVTYVFFVLFVC